MVVILIAARNLGLLIKPMAVNKCTWYTTAKYVRTHELAPSMRQLRVQSVFLVFGSDEIIPGTQMSTPPWTRVPW